MTLAKLIAEIRATCADAERADGGVLMDPAEVRALCDAADEVERLREEVRDTRAILDAAGTEVRRERARAEAAEDEIAATSETISLLSHRMGDATAQIKRMATEHLAAAERAQVEIERLRHLAARDDGLCLVECDRHIVAVPRADDGEAESPCSACERDASRTAHAALRDWLAANAPTVLADFDRTANQEDQ